MSFFLSGLSLEYNLLPRRWPEASMLSDGKSATVPNPQLGQLRETVTPFISDTEQQEGGLTTPVDPPLTGQNFWDLEWMKLAERKFQAFKAKLTSEMLKPLYRLKPLDGLEVLDWLKVFNRLKALKTLHTLQASDMLKALDALNSSDLLDALDVLEALEQRVHWGKAGLEARLERIRVLLIFHWTLTKKVPASFSLKELISLLKSIRSGWGPPLEMATRMLNSKFWVMEADVWADPLIVCCWANPKIFYCEKCGNNVELATTSCKHVVCPVCTVGQGIGPSCPECGQALTVSFSRKRRLCEPPTTATKRPCIDSASTGSCSHESQSKSYTTDILHKLLIDLRPAMIKWYYLGLALGLHHHDLDAIEMKRRGDSLDCLREMLVMRLKQKLSKEELIQSLQEHTVGFSELAQTLKDSKQW